MAFGRKATVVGTPMDREELEQLLDRIESATEEIKNAMWELKKTTDKAARVMKDLNTAVERADAAGRRRLSRGS